MLYFIKNGTVHQFPVPRRCGETYTNQQLRDTIPHDSQECVFCLHRWPEDDANRPSVSDAEEEDGHRYH